MRSSVQTSENENKVSGDVDQNQDPILGPIDSMDPIPTADTVVLLPPAVIEPPVDNALNQTTLALWYNAYWALWRPLDSLYYSPTLGQWAALILTIGKVAQAAGQDIFGLLAILTWLKMTSEEDEVSILLVLVTCNVIVNIATRGLGISEACQPPKIMLVGPAPDATTHPSVRAGTVISIEEAAVYQYSKEKNTYEKSQFTTQGQLVAEALFAKWNTRLRLPNDSLLATAQDYRFITPELSCEELSLFAEMQCNKVSTPYATTDATVLFYVSYTLCLLSVPFSAMSAYLSGVTLAEKICQVLGVKLDAEDYIFFGSFVTVCSNASYISFNVPKMREGVDAFCKRLAARSLGDRLPLVLSIFLTIGGILIGLGMADLVMTKNIEILPLLKDAPLLLKEIFIYANLVTTLATNIFGFAYKNYQLIDSACQFVRACWSSENNLGFAWPSKVSVSAMIVMFLDSMANASGGLVGMLALLSTNFNKDNNASLSQAILYLCLYGFVCNVSMNFAFGVQGFDKPIGMVENFFAQFTRCFKYGMDSVYGRQDIYAPLIVIDPDAALDAVPASVDVEAGCVFNPYVFPPTPHVPAVPSLYAVGTALCERLQVKMSLSVNYFSCQ